MRYAPAMLAAPGGLYTDRVESLPNGGSMTPGGRAFASAVSSVVLGGLFGGAAAVGMGVGYLGEFGVIFGAIVGLVCSPLLIFALSHGPWLVGLVIVAAPTLLAAYVGGLLTPPNGGPERSLAMSVSVFAIASLALGVIARKRHAPPPSGHCSQCRYNRTGLPPDAVCPECGADPPSEL